MADSTTSYSVDLSHVLQDLKEKFKHGEHITRILEGQLETAQQNISLLQGQVRLANETIDNLKQQFKSSENAVYFLLENSDRVAKDMNLKVNLSDRGEQCGHIADCSNQEEQVSSPKSVIILQKDGSQEYVMSSSANSHQGNPEKPKSPYAQQLRQVLDILQNEEPSKKFPNISSSACQSAEDYQTCNCPDCNGAASHRHTPSSSQGMCKSLSCTCSYHMANSNQQHEREKTKVIAPWCSSPKMTNGIDIVHSNGDMRLVSTIHKGSGTQHMAGRASPPRSSFLAHSQCGCNGSEHHNKYKLVDRGHASSCHYTASCSEASMHHGDDAMQHCKAPCSTEECNEGCSCHSYAGYATPYGYQVLDPSPSAPHTIHPVSSPGRKRKRFPGVIQVEDPPHLKYTKIKRIDGSKLTAQKTIADFSKRRYLPCNPRFDLDLLIVPPPISAVELLGPGKENQNSFQNASQEPLQSLGQNEAVAVPIIEGSEEECQEKSSKQDFSQGKEAATGSIGASSPGSSASYVTDDNVTIYLENNNMRVDHDRKLLKSPIGDITNTKLPHFMSALPPSLSTKS